jgi:hypothetical protein
LTPRGCGLRRSGRTGRDSREIPGGKRPPDSVKYHHANHERERRTNPHVAATEVDKTPPAKNSKATWVSVIRQVQTPLAFYALALLIVESALTVTVGLVDAEHKATVFYSIIAVFVMVILIVTALVIWDPKRLLYGKEELANPALEPSALRDQIEDLIQANVKPECLKIKPN